MVPSRLTAQLRRPSTSNERIIPGEAVFIPLGEKHHVINIGEGQLRLIEIKAPAASDFIIVPHRTDGKMYAR